jgi:ribosomal protein L29
MATIKSKEIIKMNSSEREKKLKELKLELVKSKANATKSGNSKSKQIRKIIARIHTINASENKSEELKKK